MKTGLFSGAAAIRVVAVMLVGLIVVSTLVILRGSAVAAAPPFTSGGATLQPEPPPANFNPLTATDEGLAKYGFLRRPTDPQGLKDWESVMSHALHYVTPHPVPSTVTVGGPEELPTQSMSK